ncbi:hypothetical protein GPECTOR_39g438 [Gonium pectorale]|uniref:Uncharacterized protein n=1 Tax=Gonium pectorale TaxID=33097 RepID=A0A150GAT9_GONPE|nr:hypothetical protein GPECTOR_39g438 [Gonium pectorale]|eukprot:KXZ46944.1 hypothetical protein GPECTOR_39g438 [Gonium pectorale]
MRFNHLKDLEPRFPGFSARAVLLGEPRVLHRSVTKLLASMLVFQDLWPASPVGPLMSRIGHHIVTDPAATAHGLRALSRALASDLGLQLDPLSLTPDCAFLRCAPLVIDSRVEALATIFGAEGAAALLRADIGVLGVESRALDEAVGVLREVFSCAGHSRVKAHHVGTPEGAAVAAADRAYVTSLAVAWPGVLALPGRLGEAGVAKLLAEVRAAGGARYRAGGGRRAVLLADVLARPEMLQTAAEAPGELRRVVAAVVEALGPAEAEKAGKAGAEEGEDDVEEEAVEGRKD